MPEGAELRHSRDVLRKIILNKTILRMGPTHVGRYREIPPENFAAAENDLSLTVTNIDVKGKFMWWELTSSFKKWYFWCTYGMSGQWSTQRSKHAAFVVEHDSGFLYFNDSRRFGTLKFVNDPEMHKKKLASLGPDLLGDERITPEIFANCLLKKPKLTISDALLEQSCVSGVGNYVRAEALLRAGINPHKLTSNLTPNEYLNLCTETIKVLKESYENHGATLYTYRTVGGELGGEQFEFRAYGKQQCPNGHTIIREPSAGGRTIHWCKICQV